MLHLRVFGFGLFEANGIATFQADLFVSPKPGGIGMKPVFPRQDLPLAYRLPTSLRVPTILAPLNRLSIQKRVPFPGSMPGNSQLPPARFRPYTSAFPMKSNATESLVCVSVANRKCQRR